MAAQLTRTKRAVLRALSEWMAWAINSLPLPVSPSISTVELERRPAGSVP